MLLAKNASINSASAHPHSPIMKCAARRVDVINPNCFWISDGFDGGFPDRTVKIANMTAVISNANAMVQYGIAAMDNSHAPESGVSVINTSFKIHPLVECEISDRQRQTAPRGIGASCPKRGGTAPCAPLKTGGARTDVTPT